MILNLERPLSFYAKRSTAVHVVLIILAFVVSKKLWFDQEKIKEANIKLVKSSVRVDVVAMPKMTLKELKALNAQMTKASGNEQPVEESPKAKEVNNETSDIEFEKTKKKQNFMDMLKNLSKKKVEKVAKKKKKVKEKPRGEGTGSGIDYGQLNKLVVEGNKLSKGRTLVGDGDTEVAEAFGNYQLSVRDEVKVFWKLPSFLLNKDFRCRVRVFISQSGKLVKAEIYESSGNKDYDAKALEAVKLAAPFPTASEDIAGRLGAGEILLGFPL